MGNRAAKPAAGPAAPQRRVCAINATGSVCMVKAEHVVKLVHKSQIVDLPWVDPTFGTHELYSTCHGDIVVTDKGDIFRVHVDIDHQMTVDNLSSVEEVHTIDASHPTFEIQLHGLGRGETIQIATHRNKTLHTFVAAKEPPAPPPTAPPAPAYASHPPSPRLYPRLPPPRPSVPGQHSMV